jgi:mannose-1-phosphate guanylyltransferase
MRYALIIAGGSGTRLWPMSRAELPKQLLPFIGGKSLLAIAFERLEGLVPAENRFICAGQRHADAILNAIPEFSRDQFLGEPTGRDTLNAVGFGAAAIAARDPDATIAVFTADHIIEPVDEFRKIVEEGFRLAESEQPTLVTFGITPTTPATSYGYLALGDPADRGARIVREFREKPELPMAEEYFSAGPDRYLWNSGMFVWRASTLLDCIRRYEPEVFRGLQKIGAAWPTPSRDSVLAEVFPTLKKISVDFAVMEPASRDPEVRVAALPMPLKWLDVGSWPVYAEVCAKDSDGNASAGGRPLLHESRGVLAVSSDSDHVIATIGCENLIIIHTPDATLVCPADQAEKIKDLHRLVGEKYGKDLL